MLGEHNYPSGQMQPQPKPRTVQNPITLTEPTIVVQCARRDIGTQHAHIAVHQHGVSIWYGNLVQQHGGQQAVFHATFENTEFLPYSLFPEARAIHDGKAWNLRELNAWIDHCFVFADDEDEQPAGV